MAKKTVKKAEPEQPRLDRFDPFLGSVEMRTAYKSLVDGDWTKLEGYFGDSPMSWLFGYIATSRAVGIETVTFERWDEARKHPQARTMHAAAMIRDVFEEMAEVEPSKRSANNSGSTRLSQIDSVRLADLQQRLKAAELMLFEVVTENPAKADPWVYLLISGRGLGIKLTELRSRFDNAHSRAEYRADACHEYLQGLTAKWGGSQKAAFEFARWVEEEAPADSPARECLPVAHIEEGLLQDGGDGFASYLTQAHVADELLGSAAKFLRSTPNQAEYHHLPTLNAYGLVLNAYSAPSARILTEVFDRIANRPTSYPWVLYKEEIIEVFHEIQSDQRRYASRYA